MPNSKNVQLCNGVCKSPNRDQVSRFSLFKRRWWFLLLAALTCFGLLLQSLPTQAAFPAPVVNVKTNYYTIQGNSPQQLRQQLNQLGPISRTGRRFDGNTQWRVRWKYGYSNRPNQCQLTSAQITLNAIITMPRWQTPTNAQPQLKQRWQRYTRALQLHENGHRDNGVAAARELTNSLRQLGQRRFSSCTAMTQQFKQTSDRIISYYSQRDKDYDRVTQHGRTQGAVFP